MYFFTPLHIKKKLEEIDRIIDLTVKNKLTWNLQKVMFSYNPFNDDKDCNVLVAHNENGDELYGLRSIIDDEVVHLVLFPAVKKDGNIYFSGINSFKANSLFFDRFSKKIYKKLNKLYDLSASQIGQKEFDKIKQKDKDKEDFLEAMKDPDFFDEKSHYPIGLDAYRMLKPSDDE